MTRTLLKLQFTLWKRTMRGNPAVLFMSAITAFYALLGLLSISIFLGMEIYDGKLMALSGAISIGTAAYAIGSVMMPGGEKHLNPAAFATMPLTIRQLFPAFVISTFMQTRSVLAVICTVVTCVVACLTIQSALGVLLVLIAMVLSFCTTILLGEAFAEVLSRPADRKSKDRAIYIAVILGFSGFLAYSALFSSGEEGEVPLTAVGEKLVWSPFGAPAGIVIFTLQGEYLKALVTFLISLLTIGICAWLWWRITNARLIAPLERGSSSKPEQKTTSSKSKLLLPGLKQTPQAMVYSRALRYWARDSRFKSNAIIMPIFSAYFLYMGSSSDSVHLYMGAVMLAFFSCSVSSNDFGYDGPANWLHIASAAPTKAVVLGRHLASITPPTILLVVYLAVMLMTAPNKFEALQVSAGVLGFYFMSIGIGVIASSHNSFATAAPGTNPWQDRSGFNSAALLNAFMGVLVGWIPLVPGVVLMVWGNFAGNSMMIVAGMVVALLIPLVLYNIAYRKAIRKVEMHYPEIFAKVRAFV